MGRVGSKNFAKSAGRSGHAFTESGQVPKFGPACNSGCRPIVVSCIIFKIFDVEE